ncbi:MAG: thiamine phosphate synthase [Polyangia bacterium]
MRGIGEIGLYGILTDPLVGYPRLAEIMVERGVRVIQLRIKNAPAAEVLREARRLREIVPADRVFVVNDDARIARDCGADGVHLGQQDAPLSEARKLLGDEAVIGLSTHTPEQTRSACALEPSYVGVGPVFPTPTKENPDPAIGLDGMHEMISVADVPAVVLGGIDHSNVDEVLAAGARNIAAVRCVNRTADPGEAIDRLMESISTAG